jgi:hypothetical protein
MDNNFARFYFPHQAWTSIYSCFKSPTSYKRINLDLDILYVFLVQGVDVSP